MTRILIVSPIPSHPQDQGNSARIFALGRLLQSAGALVDFLYYPLEGLSPSQHAAMAQDWDALHLVPVIRADQAPRAEGFHHLDDWYDPRVGAMAAALHRRHRYAAVIANYVWFSAVLDAFGPETLKILDTHDVFGDRDIRFAQAGLDPAWFWTRPEHEARGLTRADIVLAIQPEEAAQFRALGHGDVRVLGHLHGQRRRTPRADGAPLTIGYLASSNPINVDSFAALHAALLWQSGLGEANLLVAGAICDKLPADIAPFTALGRIDHVAEFYDRVDLVVNPMTFGTGLKIKSVEALFEGLPLVATEAAMVGLPARHPLHRLPDAVALAAALPPLIHNASALASLARASAACAQTYTEAVRRAATTLWQEIARSPHGSWAMRAPPSYPPPSTL